MIRSDWRTFAYPRTGTPAQQIRLIVTADGAVLLIDMRCDKSGNCVGVLLSACLVLASGSSFAERPKVTPFASEWQKGKRFAPTQSESLRLCAGTTVQLGAKSAVEVQTKVPLPTSVEGLGPYAYAAQLTAGRIDIAIDPKQKPASGVLIYGPRRTTVLARGGHVSVVAGPSTLAVGVYDGKEASVGVGTTWKHITAGNMIAITADAPSGVESKLPGPTNHVAVDRPVLAIEGLRDRAVATWDPVPEAKRYLVDVENTETKLHRQLESNQPQLALSGFEAGRYALSVAAVDAMGLTGAPSAAVFFNVVGLELPRGAFVSQGKVYLEALQQVTLTHVDGLEATYDRAPVYFKAASRASLRGTQATTLHLRVPGSTVRTSLDILPRALHTQVEIFPALARWPRDKVTVRIQLPKLLSDTPSIKLIPSVVVNGQSLELDWVRTEQALEAVIPAPPNYPGPWVLRAQVADQHGIVLGHNFLEIASTAGLDDEDIPREIHRGAVQVQAKR